MSSQKVRFVRPCLSGVLPVEKVSGEVPHGICMFAKMGLAIKLQASSNKSWYLPCLPDVPQFPLWEISVHQIGCRRILLS